MLRQEPIKAKWHIVALGRAKDYNQLLKPNLSGMVVFSSVIGYLMAPNISFSFTSMALWQRIITLFLGGMMVTGGANTIMVARDGVRVGLHASKNLEKSNNSLVLPGECLRDRLGHNKGDRKCRDHVGPVRVGSLGTPGRSPGSCSQWSQPSLKELTCPASRFDAPPASCGLKPNSN